MLMIVSMLVGAGIADAQRIPGQSPGTSSIQGAVRDADERPVGGARVQLRQQPGGAIRETITTGDGIFRFVDVPAGDYTIAVTHAEYQPSTSAVLRLSSSELLTTTVTLQRVEPLAPSAPSAPGAPVPSVAPVFVRPQPNEAGDATATGSAEHVFVPMPDRWNIMMPDWDRYGVGGEVPYVARRWWDPYNQNLVKGDRPIVGQRTFFTFTGVSDSLIEGRNVPVASGVSTERPNSEAFYGRGTQVAPVTVVRTSLDLFRGDTAYRPVDWRIRVQPAFSFNFLNTAELGAVNFDVRRGNNRFDTHLGVQEAFAEVKIADLSANYDFVSVRAGIQGFSSDFRGFISVLEAPGVRVFGTLRNSRLEYNVALFDLLEKDTNSGFNEWARRNQQVYVANVYIQDFIAPGYTASFSFHVNRDRGELHYDHGGFLVRPAPIGLIAGNDVDAYYLGWAGSGHLGRLNLSHAFYQVVGNESANPIAARSVDINAQMAAAEVSIDRDWLRFKTAVFFASGDADPADGHGRGFDAIVDTPVFAGGPFSSWNRNGLRLPQTGVGLVSPFSLLPSLRTNKDEGHANFVNPGIALINGAVDAEVTPKLRAFATLGYSRFVNTASLRALLFQDPVRPSIGIDYGGGVQYRPPLSDNVVIVAGFTGMRFGAGMQDIYTRDHVFSSFLNMRLVF